MICSNWTLVWDALTLLEPGDWLGGELEIDSGKPLDVRPLLRRATVLVRDLGGIARTVAFRRLYELPTAHEARDFALAQIGVIEAMGVHALTITPRDGTAVVYAGMGCPGVSVEFADGNNELLGNQVWVNYNFVGG